MDKKIIYIIGIIFFTIILLLSVFLIYYGITNKPSKGTPCTETNQCSPTQLCVTGGYCEEIS